MSGCAAACAVGGPVGARQPDVGIAGTVEATTSSSGENVLPLPAEDASPVLVVDRREVTDHVAELDLQPVGADWTYRPGQYLTLYVREPDGQLKPRWYSLASYPEPGAPLQVIIKQNPGGFGSTWLRRHAVVGATLLASPPQGSFIPRPFERTVVLLGAGSGIVPLVSIGKAAVLESQCDLKILRCSTSREDVIARQGLESVCDLGQGRVVLTEHFDDEHGGRPTTSRLAEWLRSCGDCDLYLCGPRAFMSLVIEVAKSLDLDMGRVYCDHHVDITATKQT